MEEPFEWLEATQEGLDASDLDQDDEMGWLDEDCDERTETPGGAYSDDETPLTWLEETPDDGGSAESSSEFSEGGNGGSSGGARSDNGSGGKKGRRASARAAAKANWKTSWEQKLDPVGVAAEIAQWTFNKMCMAVEGATTCLDSFFKSFPDLGTDRMLHWAPFVRDLRGKHVENAASTQEYNKSVRASAQFYRAATGSAKQRRNVAIKARRMCVKCFAKLHGVSYESAKRWLRQGEPRTSRGTNGNGFWTHTIYSWFSIDVAACGDDQPNKDAKLITKTAWSNMFKRFKTWFESTKVPRPVCTQAWFVRCAKAVMVVDHIRRRYHRGVSGKCETCEQITNFERAANQQGNRGWQQLAQKLRSLHNWQFNRPERQRYTERIDLAAKQHPERYLSIAIDGFDKKKTAMPRLLNSSTHRAWNGDTLTQKIVGALVHGVGLFMYRSFDNVPVNTDLLFEVIMRTVVSVAEKRGKLPPVLLLQLDGGSENRSQMAYALVTMLVSKGIFEEVIHTRLPVGHTHIDIDQAFSTLTKEINKKLEDEPLESAQLLSPSSLCDLMKSMITNTGEPYAVAVEDILTTSAWSAWLKPYTDEKGISNYATKDHTIHQWRARRISAEEKAARPDWATEYNANGVVLEYRSFASDLVVKIKQVNEKADATEGYCVSGYMFSVVPWRSVWHPNQDAADEMDRAPINLLPRVPGDDVRPHLAAQEPLDKFDFEKSIKSILSRIGNAGDSFYNVFTDASRDDWQAFLEDLRRWRLGDFRESELRPNLLDVALQHARERAARGNDTGQQPIPELKDLPEVHARATVRHRGNTDAHVRRNQARQRLHATAVSFVPLEPGDFVLIETEADEAPEGIPEEFSGALRARAVDGGGVLFVCPTFGVAEVKEVAANLKDFTFQWYGHADGGVNAPYDRYWKLPNPHDSSKPWTETFSRETIQGTFDPETSFKSGGDFLQSGKSFSDAFLKALPTLVNFKYLTLEERTAAAARFMESLDLAGSENEESDDEDQVGAGRRQPKRDAKKRCRSNWADILAETGRREAAGSGADMARVRGKGKGRAGGQASGESAPRGKRARKTN